MAANARPLRRPTAASRRMMRQALVELASREGAHATVMVWVPAFPPMDATIGIRIASTIRSRVLEELDDVGGHQGGAHVHEEPGKRLRWV